MSIEPGPAYHEMTSFAALEAAFRKARRGQRGAPEESAFFLDLEPELLQLERDLRTFTYEPRPYRYFQIRDPKPRTISVAAFRDRVVHHALVGAMEPAFEAGFWRHSYACRKGKGTHRALAWTRHYARRFPYFLKLDVRKFFDHVSHPVLLQEIARRIDDPGILWLCATILSHAHVPGAPAATGIPIGNLTSQFWGNVALDVLDDLTTAAYTKDRREILAGANLRLTRLRVMLRLSRDIGYLSGERFERAVRVIDETGRMIGGWAKAAPSP